MSNKNKAVLIVVLLQIIFFGTWFALEKSKLSSPKAQTIKVRSYPIDPRDLLSGNYIRLNYKFSSPFNFKNYSNNISQPQGQKIYAVLHQEGDDFVGQYLSLEEPKIKDGQVAIAGVVGNFGQIEYGIEKYFVNENNTVAPTLTFKDVVIVELVIDDGLAAHVKSVTVNGAAVK